MRASKATLIALLVEARRLENKTVKTTDEIAAWHRKTDRALYGRLGDDASQRYDAPAYVEHRRFVDLLFTRHV
jgi:hypothetical protein